MNGTIETTWVCELTPEGRGAIASIGIRGASAKSCLAKHLRVLRKDFAPGQLAYGVWHRDSERGEEGVVIACVEPNAFEVQVHGGTAAVRNILVDLETQGCVVVDTSRWLELTQSNRIQAICLQHLVRTRTTKMTSFVLKQNQGLIEQSIRELHGLIESHDDIKALALARELLSTTEVGIHFTKPWNVVIAGPPNVGKSCLLNAIVGFKRAIVSPIPGTTRDALGAEIALEGWPIHLEDVAGIHASNDPIEVAGIEKAKLRIVEADLVLLVVDASVGLQPAHLQVLQMKPRRVLGVVNKCDLFISPPGLPEVEGVATWVRANAVNPNGTEAIFNSLIEQLVPPKFNFDRAILIDQLLASDLQIVGQSIEKKHWDAARTLLEKWLLPVVV